MYLKAAIIRLKTSSKAIIEKIDSSKSSESFNFDDDLSDIENIQ